MIVETMVGSAADEAEVVEPVSRHGVGLAETARLGQCRGER